MTKAGDRRTKAVVLLSLAVLVGVTLPVLPIGWGALGIRDVRIITLHHVFLGALLWHLAGNLPMKLFGVLAVAVFAFTSDSVQSMTSMMLLTVGYGLHCMGRRFLSVRLDMLLNVLCAFVLVQSTYQIVQYYGHDFLFQAKAGHGGSETWCGFTGNPNVLASLQAFALPAFTRGRWKIFFLVPLVCLLAISNTATAVLALAVGAGIAIAYKFLRDEKSLSTGGVVALLMLCSVLVGYIEEVDKRNIFTNERWQVWGDTVEMIKERPLRGYGLGMFKVHYRGTPGALKWNQAHNDYLQAGMELGVLSLVLAVAFIAGTGKKLIANKRGAVALGMFATLVMLAAGHFPFHEPDTAMWACLFLGAVDG